MAAPSRSGMEGRAGGAAGLNERLNGARHLATRIVVGQALVTALAALIALLVSGAQAGWSAGLGGGIGTAATLYMAMRALGGTGDEDGRGMLGRFFRAEFLKIGLTVFLFVLAFKFLPVAPAWLLGAYAATFAAYWFAMIGDTTGTMR